MKPDLQCGLRPGRTLLQDPIDIFVDETERMPRLSHAAVIAPDYERHADKFFFEIDPQ